MLEHLDDLESDFRVFHRLAPAEVLRMAGAEFLALAYRIGAYAGAVQAVMTSAAYREEQQAESGRVESTPTALQNDAALADLIDYG